jgi:hypothetical protein
VNYHPVWAEIPKFEASLFDDSDGYYWPCSETFPKFICVPDNEGVEDKEGNERACARLNREHPMMRRHALKAMNRAF